MCVLEQLGAYDGVTYSNTLALERCFGWRGLLIEANAKNYAKLAQSGRAATVMHAGVCAEGVGQLRVSDKAGPTASVSNSVSKAVSKSASSGHFVPCSPLPTLMAAAQLQRATLLSLDVEGAEEAVLSTVPDFAAAFEFLLIEDDGSNRRRTERLLSRLSSGGMVELREYRIKNSRLLRANHSRTLSGTPRAPARGPAVAATAVASGPVPVVPRSAPPPRLFTAADAQAPCVLAHASPAERLLHASVLAASRPTRRFVEVLPDGRVDDASLTRGFERCFGFRGMRLSAEDGGRTTLRALMDEHGLGPTIDLVAISMEAPWRFLTSSARGAASGGAAATGDMDMRASTPDAPLANAVAVDWARRFASDRWERCTACHLTNRSQMRAALYYDRRLTPRFDRLRVYERASTCYAPAHTNQRGAKSCFGAACVWCNPNVRARWCQLGCS